MLPFANLGGDPEQDWFSDGVVDDIITALSRFRSFAVVARSSSFVYKGRAVDVRQVARELGVRYVLEGSVRRAGDRLRITAQLVDGDTGAQLWAEHFDGALDDVFDFQDRITEDVAMHRRAADPGGGDRALAAGAARAASRPTTSTCRRCRMINKQTARENAEAYALLTRRAGARAGQSRCCSRTPPGRSGTAARWAGRRSGRTTSRACVELARRGAAARRRATRW